MKFFKKTRPFTPGEHSGIVTALVFFVSWGIGFLLEHYGVMSDDIFSWFAWNILTAYAGIKSGDSIREHIQFCIDSENLK